MKKCLIVVSLVLTFLGVGSVSIQAEENQESEYEGHHHWVKSSEDYHEIEAGTHDYSYWKNFIKYDRTCLKTHIIRTVVYYCHTHNHTKSETFLHETKHSLEHGE